MPQISPNKFTHWFSKMKQILDEYLSENGIEAQKADDDVMFSVNDLNFICRFYPDDPFFIQFILPYVDERNASEMRDYLTDVNRRFKVAKMIEVDGKPWIVAESFVYSKDKAKLLIGRLVRLLTDVYDYYRQTTSEMTSSLRRDGRNDDNEL